MQEVIEKWKDYAKIGIILGSGLNESIHEMMDVVGSIDYKDVDGVKASTAPGHVGRFLFGTINEVPVIAMQGRLHYYEGHSMKDIVAPIHVLYDLGVESLLVTNAAGGINLAYQAGDFMLISDHINFLGTNPLIGPRMQGFERFPDMSFTYDRVYIQLLKEIAEKHKLTVHTGVYIATTGPSYETPAEIRAFRTLGADAVGMSTVPEVIAACQLKMRVCGISLISNMAAGVLEQKLSEEEVLEAGRQAKPAFKILVSEFVRAIGGK